MEKKSVKNISLSQYFLDFFAKHNQKHNWFNKEIIMATKSSTRQKPQEYDFIMKLKSAEQLLSCFEMLKIADIATCHVNFGTESAAVEILALHDSHSSIFSMVIYRDAVDEIISNTPVTVGIDVDEFLKYIRVVNKTDEIKLSIERGNRETLKIEFKSKVVSCASKLDIRLIGFDEEQMDALSWEPMCSIFMGSKHFSRIIRTIKEIDPVIKFTFKHPSQFIVSVSGLMGEVSMIINDDDTKDDEDTKKNGQDYQEIKSKQQFEEEFTPIVTYNRELVGKDEFEMLLDSKRLLKYIKGDILSNTVKLDFTIGQPALFEYQVLCKDDPNVEFATIKLYQSPRVAEIDLDPGCDPNNDSNVNVQENIEQVDEEVEEPQDYDMEEPM